MKMFLVLATIILAASAANFLDEEWTLWKSNYEIKYVNSKEEVFRRQIWEETRERVQTHNSLAAKGLKNYTLAMNIFADRTDDELIPRRGPCNRTHKEPKPDVKPEDAPVFYCDSKKLKKDEVVDWRDSKCVTPVKNSGVLCVAWWAFGTVGVLESRYCIKHRKLYTFSEQQLLDCSENGGCCGGSFQTNFQYALHKGLMKKNAYKYEHGVSECQYNPKKSVKVKVAKYYNLIEETSMANAVATGGPVAVTIEASKDFFLYNEGIFDGECSPSRTHGMTIVGYGKACGTEYWLLKNSFGKKWGEDGYVKVKRNVNQCGISKNAVAADIE